MPKKKTGVEPFLDNLDDEVINDDDDDESEEVMAKETAKAKARRTKEVEEEDEDEVEEEDDEATDEAEDDTEDDDEDDDEEPDEYAAFTPFIVHENQEWELDDILTESNPGEDVFLYHLQSGHWYKLAAIKIGELPAS
jgi:hypothetical protein